jgi:hypothetical protein
MLKSLSFIWAVPAATIFAFLASPALANCPGALGSPDTMQPVMQRQWQRVQQQTSYPWGTVRPYGSISGDRVTLTPEFDRLTYPQKQQVLDTLLNANLNQLMTPAELEALYNTPGFGPTPFRIYASDGRAVSLPYDACTRNTLLTERARYSWYYNQQLVDRTISSEGLRNIGRPSWRQVRYPITAERERNTRNQFWNAVGYNQAANGWWIAWVPEHGYFEINVPPTYDSSRLQRFWQSAPRQTRYVVVNSEGTLIQERSL